MKENTFFNREFYIKSTRIVLSVILCLLGEFLLSEEKTNLATNLSVMLQREKKKKRGVLRKTFDDNSIDHCFLVETIQLQ